MLVRQKGLALLVAAAISASCGDDASGSSDSGPAQPALDAALDASSDAGTDADATVEEVDPTAVINLSFDAAKHLELGPVGALQPLESASQVHYFWFDAEAGEVYVIATNRGRFAPNNVLAFYDPSREKVAENDVGRIWPGDLVDARLIVRARESGRHYVVIEDRELPEEAFTNEGVPTFYYRVTSQHLEPSSLGVAWEPAAGDPPAPITFAEDEASGVAHVTLIGELENGETDRFTLHGGDAQVLVGHVLPGGPSGNGSTLVGGVVGVLDATDHLVAQIDRGLGSQFLHPPLADTDYTLSVRADGDVGDNAFYAIDLVLLPDNPSEQPTDNDTLDTAQPLELFGGFVRRGSFLAELPAFDRDYFEIVAQEGDRLDVICEGESAGSGVRGLHAELRDRNDVVLGERVEAVDTGLFLSGVTASQAGPYYLFLWSETPVDAEAAPPWVRCAVIAEL